MADDFAHFRFHTPFFYGQLYSSGLEAWLAAPFIWLGIPVYRAVPLVTALMSTLPWIWMSHLARKRSGNLAGSAILCLSLAFPISWLQTTYISRGFMQSVFLTSFATRLIDRSRLWFNVGLILMGWGLMQNANGLLLLPGIFPIWITAFRRFAGIKSTPVRQAAVNSIRLVWPATLGLILLGITYATLKSQHPEWMIHATVQTNFSWQVFSESIQRYNWFLQHTYGGRSPLLGCGLIALAVLLVATPTSKNQWLGFLGILLLPLVMLAVEKTTDGTENIFFGYGRFFLAIPFAWGWLVSSSAFSFRGLNQLWEITFKHPLTLSGKFQIKSKLIKPAYSICLFAAVGLYGYRFWDKCSIRELGKTYVPVMIYPINQLRGDAEKMANLCRTQKIGAVVVLDHYVLETASMGFQQLAQFPFKAGTPKQLPGGGFPYDTLPILSIPIEIGPSIFKIHETIPIIRPKYERRHWLLKEIKDHHYIPHKVAVMDVFKDSAWGDRLPFKHTLSDVRGPVFIFETGEMTLSDFLDLILKPSE